MSPYETTTVFRTLKLTLLLAAASLLLALAGPGGPHALPLLPGEAAAAQCKGASKGPKRLATKRAEALVVCLVNKQRREVGVGRLKHQKEMRRAADRHSAYMKRSNCFAHTCPGEAGLSGRLTASSYLPCSCSWNIGESIGYGKRGRASPRKIVHAWMNSASHRSTLLRGGFEHVGVGFKRGTPYSSSKRAGTYTIDFGYKR